MTATLPALLVPLGILFSQDILQSGAFQFLAAFVAVNTIMYVALAVAKVLPKVYLSDWRPGHSRRSETRNIHPEHRGEKQPQSLGDRVGGGSRPDPPARCRTRVDRGDKP